MTTLNRRAFFGVTPFAVGAALQTFAAFNTSRGSGRLTAPLGAGGYGGLRVAKARNTGEEILTLPEGFEYNVIGKTGMKMSDGDLTPAAHDGMEAALDMPDNICVSPNGGLILCEDGNNEQYVRGLTRDGKIFDFAKNILPGYEDKEFAGATFSPDGHTLFVNIQTPGVTLAIWGPWERGTL